MKEENMKEVVVVLVERTQRTVGDSWGDDDTSYSYVYAVYENGFPLNDKTLSLIVDDVIKDVKRDYDDDEEEDGEKHDLHVSEVRFVDCDTSGHHAAEFEVRDGDSMCYETLKVEVFAEKVSPPPLENKKEFSKNS